MVGHVRIEGRHASDVNYDYPCAIRSDSAQKLLRELTGTLRINGADDRKNQEPLSDLQHRGRKLTNGFLLFSNYPLALVNETHRDGIGNTIRRRLVSVENLVQLGEIVLIFCEQ